MTQQWIYGIADIKDARHIQTLLSKVLISNHTECTPEYDKHITHWPKGSTCSDTTKCDTLCGVPKLMTGLIVII